MKVAKLLKGILLGVASLVALSSVSCSNSEQFTPVRDTEYFVQDLNPETLDILWVIDNRSPMYYAKSRLQNLAGKFFGRLDKVSRDYRMAFTNADMLVTKGRLKPNDSSIIFKRNIGTEAERLSLVTNFVSQIVNVGTSAENRGFTTSFIALSQYFVPRANVPLVVIYVSYTDDHSDAAPGSTDAVQYFTDTLKAFKSGKPELLKVYAINYVPLPAGGNRDKYRCIDIDNPEIDRPGYEDRYFRVARATGGDTADICADETEAEFADKIDLTGLRLKELPKRFKLTKTVQLGSFIVSVTLNESALDIPWTFDAATNEVVFDTTPPEGSRIQITYLQGSSN